MTDRRVRILSMLVLLTSDASAHPVGWRADGTAVFTQATPPINWDTPRWRSEIHASGNASPIRAGDLVVVTAEPSRLIAIHHDTGEVRWSHEHPIVESLSSDETSSLRSRIERAPELERAYQHLRQQYALLLRKARAGDPEATPEAITSLDTQISTARTELDALAPYLTPPTGDGVGYASPTPVFDGEHLFVQFGHGMVASYNLQGKRRWMRWLGPIDLEKKGYRGTDTASPLRVGDALITSYGHLRALDAATGETLWKGPRYEHFGTPAVIELSGHAFLVTPSGQILDAATGEVQPPKLDEVYYCGPVVQGDTVYFAGSASGWESNDPVGASAWRLHLTDEGVQATERWRVTLPSRDRVYAQPTWHNNELFIASRFRRLVVLEHDSGEMLHHRVLSETPGEVWASPVIAGDRLYVLTVQGHVHSLDLQDVSGPVRTQTLSPSPATPWFEASTLYWRGASAVYRFDAP